VENIVENELRERGFQRRGRCLFYASGIASDPYVSQPELQRWGTRAFFNNRPPAVKLLRTMPKGAGLWTQLVAPVPECTSDAESDAELDAGTNSDADCDSEARSDPRGDSHSEPSRKRHRVEQ
jgi:hypothetical protein